MPAGTALSTWVNLDDNLEKAADVLVRLLIHYKSTWAKQPAARNIEPEIRGHLEPLNKRFADVLCDFIESHEAALHKPSA